VLDTNFLSLLRFDAAVDVRKRSRRGRAVLKTNQIRRRIVLLLPL
jgi:hypothetical protein